MSGPCCKDCRFYYPNLLGNTTQGECTDHTKRIFYKHGGAMNGAPEVNEEMTCANWQAKRTAANPTPPNVSR